MKKVAKETRDQRCERREQAEATGAGAKRKMTKLMHDYLFLNNPEYRLGGSGGGRFAPGGANVRTNTQEFYMGQAAALSLFSEWDPKPKRKKNVRIRSRTKTLI